MATKGAHERANQGIFLGLFDTFTGYQSELVKCKVENEMKRKYLFRCQHETMRKY